MPQTKKEFLIQEAKMQTKALLRLGIWNRAALSLTVIGGLLAWTGFGAEPNILRGVFGILTAIVSGAAAYLISLGRRHGKQNVENILKAAEQL